MNMRNIHILYLLVLSRMRRLDGNNYIAVDLGKSLTELLLFS